MLHSERNNVYIKFKPTPSLLLECCVSRVCMDSCFIRTCSTRQDRRQTDTLATAKERTEQHKSVTATVATFLLRKANRNVHGLKICLRWNPKIFESKMIARPSHCSVQHK